MKKWFLCLPVLMIFLMSCSKSSDKCNFTESNAVAVASEVAYLQNLLNVNSVSATAHPSGIFYVVDDPGAGSTASVCSNIRVNYTGTLLSNATVFDSNNAAAGVSFVLGQLIVGWQKGLPLIRTGGRITIYIPPSLGYGSEDRTDQYGAIVIPANSYLKFEIHLLDVQ